MRKIDLVGPDAHAVRPTPIRSIGENLKALRRDRHITLAAAAEACSVSSATLSRIENGLLSPTFDVISKICSGLGIGIRDLLSYAERRRISGWRTLTRAGTGRVIETPQYRFELLCDDVITKPYLIFRAEILMRSIEEFGALQSHAGHEQIVVQSGRVEVWIEHYTPTVLEVGDSLAFDSTLGHALISLSDAPANVLWTCDSQEV